MRSLLGRRLLPVTGLLTVVLALGTIGAPAQADDGAATPDTSTPDTSTPDTSTPEAAAALAQVEELVGAGTPATARRATRPTKAHPADGRDLTLALRDLRVNMDGLSRTDKAAAQRVTKRPQADLYQDFGSVRVHWMSTDAAITAAWVAKVGQVVNHVLSTYAEAGYRAPESDGARGGGDGLLDIYLVDFAAQAQYGFGLYGFCDTDTSPDPEGPYDTWAYCAFDHTFEQFPRTPTANLKVTAAHELFHATQFAYDYNEDAWFMEATAVWAEDEVYDSINDNLQYLAESPLRQPGQSLDQFGDGLRQYGEWIFFRYLSERFSKKQGGMPSIVRKIWERADGSAGGTDDYSIQAVSNEIASRDTDLRRVFAQFADANRRPKQTYAEGSTYRRSPARGETFTPKAHDTGWQTTRVDHLASRTYAVRPGAKLAQRKLRVNLDLPATKLGSAAVLTWYDAKGHGHRSMVKLSKKGTGSATVRFGATRVSRVDLTLANASIRSRCWRGAVDGVEFSCRGVPRDDRQQLRYRIRAID